MILPKRIFESWVLWLKEVVAMKYFLNDTERRAAGGTCYHEFHRGKWDGKSYWYADSLNIHDDWIWSLGLARLICSVIDYYDEYGETEVNAEQWKKIYEGAEKIGGELFEAVKEVAPWAEDNFHQHEVFTILGI